MPNLVGIGLSQVPTNSMLGGLAYQDPEHASIKDLDLKNLSQINSEIADTATDVFVYDTRKDSDGGAWRKRTQNTSWYNETLGTAIRGTRKEFPAVAVLVLEDDRLTIYDGDDPDMPMWMTFNTKAESYYLVSGYNDHDLRCVTALNGIIAVGNSLGYNHGGLIKINFIKDDALATIHTSNRFWTGGIINRNSNAYWKTLNNGEYIASNDVKDISMTVLPNAPIDPSTGLPVPTIAVATDGGVSVIKDDGVVVDLTYLEATNNAVPFLDIDSNGRIYWSTRKSGSIGIYFHEADLPTSNSSSEPPVNLSVYQAGAPNAKRNLTSGTLTDVVRTKDKTVLGTDGTDGKAHLNLYNTTGNVNSGGSLDNFQMVDISKDYNTGYMHGDIKGAFLSDTDTANLVDTNLVSNGTFDSNYTGWSSSGVITLSIDTGRLKMVSGSGNPHVHTSVTCVVGKRYYVQLDWQGAVSFHVSVQASSVGDVALIPYSNPGSMTTFHCFFTATATTMWLVPHVIGGGSTGYIDNVICKLADDDRTANGSTPKATVGGVTGIGAGLATYGTITKTPVATGAELVSYGSFNNSNNFRQPHNSNLNFEQNNFSIMFWVYDTGVNQHCTLISRDEREFDISRLAAAYGNKLRIYTRNSAEDLRSGDSASAFPFNKWTHVCVTYTGGNRKKVYMDGELDTTITGSAGEYDIDSTTYGLNIGVRNTGGTKNYSADGVQLALMRISGSAPSPEQVKKMYEDEKHLFQENAKATLYGSSDAVKALAFDDTTNLLHVGTSSGRSEFQGLRRINNTTTAVTTAISVSNGLVAEQ